MSKLTIRSRLGAAAAGVLSLFWLTACTDTVYRDRPPFNPPPDAASGFLGYFDQAEAQTTCGNCHVDHQGDWSKTAHAGAYLSLVNSGHAAPACYGCHTVSERGNDATGSSGWNAVQSKAYYDVQCESCHGPGEAHVTTPDVAAPPLSRISLKDSTTGCGSCHTGEHTPYVEEWSASRHGRANPDIIAEEVAEPGSEASCMACHEARGILKAWGVTTNYAERDQALTEANAMGQQCGVCHNPHDATNDGQLRFPVEDPALDNNLCMKCHARRFEPAMTSSRGPHAPQGAVVIGTAGWWPPGYDTTAIVATHGNPSANPRFCAGCHVNRLTVNDAAGNFTFQSVGHLFRPIPCLDATGKPIADNSCAYTEPARTWAACAGSGCHASATQAVNAFGANRAVMAVLANQIWVDVNASGSVNAGDTGYLSQVPSTEFSTTDSKITVAEGALFNVRMVGEGRYDNGDKSMAVHNPFLSQAILAASIEALQATYALPAPPAAVQQLLDKALQQAGRAPVAVSANR